jgi:type IV secretion system protein VirB6
VNWHLFTQIWTTVGDPLNALVTAVYTGLFAYIKPGFKGGAVLFLSFTGGLIACGRMGSLGKDWLPVFVRVVLFAAVLNVTFFNTAIRDVFMHTIPEGLINTIAQAGGVKNLTNATVPQTFDKTFIDAMASGIKVAQNADGWSASAIARAIFIYVIFLPLAALAIFVAFAIWFASQFLLAIVVAFGPPFLAFLAFPATRSWGERWISAAMGIGLLQAMVMLALSMILAIETTLVKGILTMDTGAADASTSQIVMLIAAVSVYLLFAYVIKQIPGLSTAMIGGAHAQLSGFSASMFGQPAANLGNKVSNMVTNAQQTLARSSAPASSIPLSAPGRPLGGMRRA